MNERNVVEFGNTPEGQQAAKEVDRAEKERRRCCLRCKAFVGDVRDISGGSCHFNPPAVFPMQGPRGIAFANAWPPVRATTDWCCHFEEQVLIKLAGGIPQTNAT